MTDWPENIQSMAAAQKYKKRPNAGGVFNGKSKLSEKQVTAIRASDTKAADLAVVYQVHVTTIQRIKNGSTW